MYTVYVLWSEKIQKRYVGSTKDIDVRLKEHNSGGNKFTKGGIPWVKIYEEKYETVTNARKRELYLKTGIGRKYLDRILKNRRDARVVEWDGLENRYTE